MKIDDKTFKLTYNFIRDFDSGQALTIRKTEDYQSLCDLFLDVFQHTSEEMPETRYAKMDIGLTKVRRDLKCYNNKDWYSGYLEYVSNGAQFSMSEKLGIIASFAKRISALTDRKLYSMMVGDLPDLTDEEFSLPD